MKVLLLCKKPTVPPIDGETIAINQIIDGLLSHGHEIAVWSLVTDKHPLHSKYQQGHKKGVKYYYSKINTKVNYLALLRSFFSKTPYILSRFWSNACQQQLNELVAKESFDIIQTEGLALQLYLPEIRKHWKGKLVHRAHNVESVIWQRLMPTYSNPLFRWYIKYFMQGKLEAFERQVGNSTNGLIAISQVDEAIFKQYVPKLRSITIPIGVKPRISKRELPESFKVGFIGDMQWLPNRDGFLWFVKNVWQDFAADKEDVECFLAGRNTAQFNFKTNKITNLGEVESAPDFMQSLSVLVVPLRSGSGMKVKVMEAMGLGKCVVTTSIGAEGISDKKSKALVVANDKKEWLQQLQFLYAEKAKIETIGNEAYTYVQKHFNLENLAANLSNFYQELE